MIPTCSFRIHFVLKTQHRTVIPSAQAKESASKFEMDEFRARRKTPLHKRSKIHEPMSHGLHYGPRRDTPPRHLWRALGVTSGRSNLQAYLLRGRGGQGGGTTGAFPAVAIYLDEQSGQLPGRNLDVYAADLERIEVLEGPQGTLYGASSEAGTLPPIPTGRPAAKKRRADPVPR